MSKPINRIITGQYPVVGLRRAKLVDLPILNALIEQSLRGLAEGHYTSRQIDSAVQFIAAADQHLIEEGTLYAVTSGGEIVGVGGWSSRASRYLGDAAAPGKADKIDPVSTPAYLRGFYVNPHWTRMGVARRLYEESVAAAKHAGFQTVEMLATPMSLPFVTALGFETKEAVEIPLPDGVRIPFTLFVKAITSSE